MLLAGLAGLAGWCGVLLVVFALAMAYPNLPSLDALTDYRPKIPLRIYTADNVLIGEFGEERRSRGAHQGHPRRDEERDARDRGRALLRARRRSTTSASLRAACTT